MTYENALIAKAQAGDSGAMDQICRLFKPLCVKLAGKAMIPGYEFADRLAIAQMTLVLAVQRFDSSKAKFMTFAYALIWAALREEWREARRWGLQSTRETGYEPRLHLADGEQWQRIEQVIGAADMDNLTGEVIEAELRAGCDDRLLKVLDMRLEDCKDREIAETLKISSSRAVQLRYQLGKRYAALVA